MYRIGFSEDIHPVKKGRKLVLGGVEIPHADGLDGHSDADVVLHAVCESILGALALGDLGKHFPDSDPKYKNIDSSIIVKEVVSMMKNHSCRINNIDVSITLEKPKLKDYIQAMRVNVANLLETEIENVSIKAGTNEKVGPLGRNEAVKAEAIVLLKEEE